MKTENNSNDDIRRTIRKAITKFEEELQQDRSAAIREIAIFLNNEKDINVSYLPYVQDIWMEELRAV